MACQRIKEVGIRKVLGATTGNIVYLVFKRIYCAHYNCFCGCYTDCMVLHEPMVADYAYRIDVSWLIFFAGGLAAIVIALATISFQAIKAAMANPVEEFENGVIGKKYNWEILKFQFPNTPNFKISKSALCLKTISKQRSEILTRKRFILSYNIAGLSLGWLVPC
jgi:hypothetical protein